VNARLTHRRTPCTLAAAMVALAGCAGSPPEQPEPAARPVADLLPYNSGVRPVSEDLGPRTSRTPMRAGELVDHVVLDPPRRDPERTALGAVTKDPEAERRRVRLAFNQATPAEVIRVLVTETLGVPHILEPELAVAQGTITLLLDEEMTDRDIYDLVGVLAEIHGWSMETRGDRMIFGRIANAATGSTVPLIEDRTLLDTADSALRVYRPRFISAAEAAKVCEPLMTPGAATVVSGNVLLVVDRVSQLNRIGQVLRTVDAPPFQGTQVWTYRLFNARPTRVSQALNQVIQNAGFGNVNGAPAIAIVPVEDLDYVMAISRDPTAREAVGGWIRMLDQPAGEDPRRRFIYRAQTADVARLANTLREVFAPELEQPGGDNEHGMRLTVDTDGEMIICYADPHLYADVLDLLSRLDGERQQVLLNATIATVTLTDELEFGVEAFITDNFDGTVVDAFLNPANAFGPANPIGTAAVTGASGVAIFRALQSHTDVRVLSRPRIFVRDREEGSFRVGGEVPVLQASVDSSVQTDGTTGVRNEIQYRDTGIFVRVQPRVNERGEVVLKIEQEITDVVANTTSGIDSPEFTTRELSTTVALAHGQTALLAGFIEQRETFQKSGLPLVSDIPVVGTLFGSTSLANERVELVLSITPTIVNTVSEAGTTYTEMMNQAALVSETLIEFAEREDELKADDTDDVERPERAGT